jgi:hypothetical protein
VLTSTAQPVRAVPPCSVGDCRSIFQQKRLVIFQADALQLFRCTILELGDEAPPRIMTES